MSACSIVRDASPEMLGGLVGGLMAGLAGVATVLIQNCVFLRNQRKKAIKAVLLELQMNKELLHNPKDPGGSFVKTSTKMWEEYAGQISHIDDSTKIQESYALLSRYNSMVDYDLAVIGSGQQRLQVLLGRQSKEMAETAQKAVAKMEEAISVLEKV